MEYTNYTSKACVLRFFKPDEKLPFQVTHFKSLREAYTYITNISIKCYFYSGLYQKKWQFSYTTFREHINMGYAKGTIETCAWLKDPNIDDVNEQYKFTCNLE